MSSESSAHFPDVITPDGATIKAEIIAEARALGFDDCRVAVAQRATHADTYEQWLADGCHGDMAWLARDPARRADPSIVLPGARSVLVLALNYYQDTPPPTDSATRGAIARYAWGADYHDIMLPKLRALCERMARHGGQQKPYVDTGPVLERDFATDAGLGWNGKSTMQIHRHLGTWFFLADIITTLDLPPDPPFGDHCGKCTRCLTACPTQAITAPHRVDARRCVSYLTIENKGAIPVEFRRAIGHRVYGCDDCLAACPWNRFAQASREASFATRDYVNGWSLREFLTLNDDGFRALFRKSPIKRIKRPAFLRNVCVALGNVGTREDEPTLRQATEDPHPLIAEHAQWAVAELQRRCDGTLSSRTTERQ